MNCCPLPVMQLFLQLLLLLLLSLDTQPTRAAAEPAVVLCARPTILCTTTSDIDGGALIVLKWWSALAQCCYAGLQLSQALPDNAELVGVAAAI
jgi:hypothetical protein